MSTQIVTSSLGTPQQQEETTYFTFDATRNSWNSLSNANIGGDQNAQALSQVLKIAEQGLGANLGVQDPYFVGASSIYAPSAAATSNYNTNFNSTCNNLSDINIFNSYISNNGFLNNNSLNNSNNLNNIINSSSYIPSTPSGINDNIYGYDYKSAGLLSVDERIRLGQCNESTTTTTTTNPPIDVTSIDNAISSVGDAIVHTTTADATTEKQPATQIVQSEPAQIAPAAQPPVEASIIQAIKPLGEQPVPATAASQPAAAQVVTTTEVKETSETPIAAALTSSAKVVQQTVEVQEETPKIVEVKKLAQAPPKVEETTITETEVVNADGTTETIIEEETVVVDDSNKGDAKKATTTTTTTEETVVTKEA